MRGCVLLVCIGLCLCGTAAGTIVRVPGDYPTIQEGLNAAVSGDTVLVAPGTYGENILWPAVNGIRLLSELGPDTTVINGGWAGSVIHVSGMATIDTATVIRGFTIRSGGGVDYGGGIRLLRSSPRIEDNLIQGNSANEAGGGICCSDTSSPIIIGNTITGNSATWNGAGIYCHRSNPTIIGNQISNNSTHLDGTAVPESKGGITDGTITGKPLYYDGAGIYCSNSNPTITGNTITSNSAYHHGGGIYCISSSPMISNNLINGNSAQHIDGGGVYCYSSNPTITGNQISYNWASHGGGIHCTNQSSPLIRYNTIRQNHASNVGDGIYCGSGSFPLVKSNNIYGNGYGAYNADNSQMLMAEYNWWGDPSGPYHPTLNPAGLGDSTNAWVDPVPWLTGPGVQEGAKSPIPISKSQLCPNFPNPFTGRTTISFTLLASSHTTLRVYDTSGRLVATLVEGRLSAGPHTATWETSDAPSGIYFCKLTQGSASATKKMVVLR